MILRVVYDAASDPFWFRSHLWPLLLFPVVASLIYWRFWRWLREPGHADVTRVRTEIAVGVVLLFVAVFPLWVGSQSLRADIQFRDKLARGQFVIVQGRVSEFVPQGPDGHPAEHFRVGIHVYEYSPWELLPGYHTPRSQGGVIMAGEPLRITDIDGRIARVEIVDSASLRQSPNER